MRTRGIDNALPPNFLQLAALIPNRRIVIGKTTVSVAAVWANATWIYLQIAHGLNAQPVFACVNSLPGGSVGTGGGVYWTQNGVDATNIYFGGYNGSGFGLFGPGNVNMGWIAIL